MILYFCLYPTVCSTVINVFYTSTVAVRLFHVKYFLNCVGFQIPGRYGPVDRVQRRAVQSQLSAVYGTESSAYNNTNNNNDKYR